MYPVKGAKNEIPKVWGLNLKVLIFQRLEGLTIAVEGKDGLTHTGEIFNIFASIYAVCCLLHLSSMQYHSFHSTRVARHYENTLSLALSR